MTTSAGRITYDLREESLTHVVEETAWAAPHGEHPMTVECEPELRATIGTLIGDEVTAGRAALGLTIEPAWKPAVRANLEVSLKLARMVDDFALPDDTEPASIFRA